MRNEITRKDELIKRHSDKLAEWQTQLHSLQSRSGTLPSMGPRPQLNTGPSHHMNMMPGTPNAPPQVAMPGLSPVSGSMASSNIGHNSSSMSHNMNPNMGMQMGQSSMIGQVRRL